VSSMLGQTHHRRQSAGGPAESARSMPRGAGTTASAAPPSRSVQDAAAPDAGGAGPGLCPECERARCARIVRITAGSCSKLQREYLVDLADAVVVVRQAHGNFELHQVHNLTAECMSLMCFGL